MPQDPNTPAPPKYPWLNGLVQAKVPDALNGLWDRFSDPGSGNDISNRDNARNGLPGTEANPYPKYTTHSMFGGRPNRVPYAPGQAPLHQINWWSGTSTPTIDPRLIDPNNNPYASEDSLSSGDIELDPSGRASYQDFSREDKYLQMLRGLTAARWNK